MKTIRDCYTCAHSPGWHGEGTQAGCSALTGHEHRDRGVIKFCDASGCNNENSERPGWPMEGNTVACSKWERR